MREDVSITRRRIAPWRLGPLAVALLIGAFSVDGRCQAGETSNVGSAAVEVVRERFPDGKVRIEREVTIDAAGNYVNHGTWRMWDVAGKLVAEGRYELGERTGEWLRWWARGEAPLLVTPPFDQFEAPFVARATFVGGQLDGTWTILDAQDRKCSCVAFRHGKRDGPATLWRPDGQVLREATFCDGVIVGDVRERGADGQLTTVATYIDGHQLVNKVVNFPGTDTKRSEAGYLAAAVNEVSPDEFWQLRYAEYAARGEAQRHGEWKTWHANGVLESEGRYEFGRENGKFTWWYANGQPAVEGQFVDGQEDGTWVWWHANGQKAAQGSYHCGELVGLWRGWTDDGRLVRRNDLDNSQAKPGETRAARLILNAPIREIAR
jgi:antitoxin component YwqK of YwqJK toxin-antitoxin module